MFENVIGAVEARRSLESSSEQEEGFREDAELVSPLDEIWKMCEVLLC